MEWWIVLSLVISNIVDDAIATLCFFYSMRRQKWVAAGLTVALNYLASWSIRNYAQQYGYIHPVAWGSGIGCFFAISFDKWWKRRQKLKNLRKANKARKEKAKSHLPPKDNS